MAGDLDRTVERLGESLGEQAEQAIGGSAEQPWRPFRPAGSSHVEPSEQQQRGEQVPRAVRLEQRPLVAHRAVGGPGPPVQAATTPSTIRVAFHTVGGRGAGRRARSDDDHATTTHQHGRDDERSCDQPGDRSNAVPTSAPRTVGPAADPPDMPTGDEPEESQQRDVVEVPADRA